MTLNVPEHIAIVSHCCSDSLLLKQLMHSTLVAISPSLNVSDTKTVDHIQIRSFIHLTGLGSSCGPIEHLVSLEFMRYLEFVYSLLRVKLVLLLLQCAVFKILIILRAGL